MRLVLAILYLSGLCQGKVLLHSASQFDPTRSLTKSDIFIRDEKLHLFIKSAKNLCKYDMGRTVILQCTGDPLTSPLVLYKDMLACPPTTHQTGPAFTLPDGHPLTVAYVTGPLCQALNHLGMEANLYTLHSLRSEAATTAFTADIHPIHVQQSTVWSSQAYTVHSC